MILNPKGCLFSGLVESRKDVCAERFHVNTHKFAHLARFYISQHQYQDKNRKFKKENFKNLQVPSTGVCGKYEKRPNERSGQFQDLRGPGWRLGEPGDGELQHQIRVVGSAPGDKQNAPGPPGGKSH